MAVADAIEAGFKQVLPDATYVKLPMADGGEGTVQSLVDATGGRILPVEVTAPSATGCRASWACWGWQAGRHRDGGGLRPPSGGARAAQSAAHLQCRHRGADPGCAGDGVDHLILGIGGSATNDGGAGMIQALGGKLLKADDTPIAPGGAGLAELATIDLSGLDPRLSGLTIEVACDVDNPLCGPKGRPPCSVRRRGNSRDGGRAGCQSGPLRGLHRAGAWQAGEGDPGTGPQAAWGQPWWGCSAPSSNPASGSSSRR